jgi:hypothetical protein
MRQSMTRDGLFLSSRYRCIDRVSLSSKCSRLTYGRDPRSSSEKHWCPLVEISCSESCDRYISIVLQLRHQNGAYYKAGKRWLVFVTLIEEYIDVGLHGSSAIMVQEERYWSAIIWLYSFLARSAVISFAKAKIRGNTKRMHLAKFLFAFDLLTTKLVCRFAWLLVEVSTI